MATWLDRLGGVPKNILRGVGDAVTGGAISGSEAAAKAAQVQATAQNNATQTSKDIYEQNRRDQAPFLDIGVRSAQQLSANNNSGAYDPGEFTGDKDYRGPGAFNYTGPQGPAAFNYAAFDPSGIQNDPGYQFELKQGLDATQNAAAARGMLHSGNTLTALTKYGTDYAGTKLNDAFNRYTTGRNQALSEYGTNLNQFNSDRNFNFQNLLTKYGLDNSSAQDAYNRSLQGFNVRSGALQDKFNHQSTLAGYGPGAASANANNGNIFATNYGNSVTSGANAQASGIVAQANAQQQGLSNVLNFASSIYANR